MFGRKHTAIFHGAIWKLSLFLGLCEVFAPSGAALEPSPQCHPQLGLYSLPALALFAICDQAVSIGCLQNPIPWRVILESRGQK